MLRRPVALLRLQHRSVWGVDRAHTPQRRQPSTTAATLPSGLTRRPLQSSKKAAIYDGCNACAEFVAKALQHPQRRQPSTTAATPKPNWAALQHPDPQRRQPSTTAATGRLIHDRPLLTRFLKEGSHLRRLQPPSGTSTPVVRCCPQRRQPSTTAATG